MTIVFGQAFRAHAPHLLPSTPYPDAADNYSLLPVAAGHVAFGQSYTVFLHASMMMVALKGH